jgi:micrococcal nuclease
MTHLYRRGRLTGWRLICLISLLLIVALVSFGLRTGKFDGISRSIENHQPGWYVVTHFVDGDTIAVNMNGHTEKVRFIGVDTPETHKPNTPVQCYGPAAAAFTKNTVGHNHIRLVSDPLSTDRDRYGRLLRYVYLPDSTDVNELLIQTGHGFYYPYFPFTKSQQFAADERMAITTHQGLWATCHPTPTNTGGYVSNPQAT